MFKTIHGLWAWAAAAAAAIVSGGEPEGGFRAHWINTESTYSACAAFDVNGDGRLDVVCGGFWYEAAAPERPGAEMTWKRHFLRDVEVIRGRFDDYSNLPIDVNADGRLDLVSANYRSQTLYWVEQPEDPTAPWTRRLIARPGAMETARLADVDGDGQLDILPNGVQFAAWWRLRPGPQPAWERHDLPPEAAGHGIGMGDVNGDGRADIVTVNGWLEAPEDRRGGRWTWHGEFQLHRDGSIPLLVWDVDGDGDQDIVWGRGHHVGLYWLEQLPRDRGAKWQKHVIDTGISQAHSLLLADIDQDRRIDLIAGARYLGHDGKDVGEQDPLRVCAYQFDPAGRSWRQIDLSTTPRAGLGLDPKAVDLDGDGDIDILGAGRSGLVWLENPGRGGAATTPATPEKGSNETGGEKTDAPQKAPAPRDHRKLDTWREDPADGRPESQRPVQTAEHWGRRRAEILAGLEAAMGPLPDSSRRVPLDVRYESRDDAGEYDRLRISYQAEPGDRVPAYLLLPHGERKAGPAMLCLHQTTGIGKGEPAGLGGSPNLHYAAELARRGFVCLVPDYPSFGDYAYDFERDSYASGSMKAIWNNLRGVDLLESLPEVHPDRIGCIGHSLGGHNALFTAAVDQRLRVAVTSCGFTGFHHYYQGKLQGWTSARYMPRIREQYGNDPDRTPFDFHEVLAAIAPRAIFVNAPQQDSNFELQGVREVAEAVRPIYQLWQPILGRDITSRLVFEHPACGHDFPPAIREQAYKFIEEQLQ